MFDVVAIVGATGAVGRIIRDLLEERSFPLERIKFLASKRSAGAKITFRGQEHVVEELTPESFRRRRSGYRQHARRNCPGLCPVGRRARHDRRR